MKILVTGAHGMVGKNVLEHHSSKSHEVWAPKRAELDLFDASQVRARLEDFRPELVIHCAGKVGGIQANINQPVEFLIENVEMNKNLIMSCADIGVPRFLNLSSSCVYPNNLSIPIKEEMVLGGPLEPTNEGYALAKIFAMKLCEYLSRTRGLSYKTIIPCNLYGRHDHFDELKSHLIPAIVLKIQKAVREGKDQIDIWGDGQSRREFMYAGDIAEFIWAAILRFDDLPGTMNVGLGYDYKIIEYYEAVAKALDFRGGFWFDLSKPTGMKRKLTDIEKLKSFGWTSQTSLEVGVQKTVDFYRKTVAQTTH